MTRFLRHIHAIRYGGLIDREVGPFGSGLNIVYGPNEAGKSTLASLVGAVLFGWESESAHGVRNTYRPDEGGRAGALTWEDILPDQSADEPDRRPSDRVSVRPTTASDLHLYPGQSVGADPSPPMTRGSQPVETDPSPSITQGSQPAGASPDPPTARGEGRTMVRPYEIDPAEDRSPGLAAAIPQNASSARASHHASGNAVENTAFPMRLVRDESAVTGDLSVIDDIDRATFDTIFSLTADELRSLRNSSDLTARLLTAGSGTASSPASAFVEVERRIANTPIYQLETELEAAQERVKEATERVKLYLQEDREMRELQVSRAATANRVSALDDEIEDLIARRAELDAAEARSTQLARELDDLRADRAALTSTSRESAIDQRLLELDSSGDRVLRDRLDEFGEEREKLARGLDIAKENSSTSTAAYEALCELDDEEVAASRRLRNRSSQAIVSVLLPVAFICAGIPLFTHGRDINSLSFTAFGVGLVVVAIFLAVAAFFVLFRQPAATEGLERRRTDAQWVMLQDCKKLDARLAEQAEFELRVAEFLGSAGLAAAEGSLRQARSLLDEARDLRAARTEDAQRASALDLRIHAAEKKLAELDAARSRLADAAGVDATDSASARLGTLIREHTAQRDALLEASEDMSRRLGELARELEYARDDHALDQAKFEFQQLRVRLREAKHELISLLLAKRMLERSIATWESQAQPEVHAHASRLLAMITDGSWVQVSTSPTGSLVAIAADGTARDPRHLSLGTCQQLYLALRIALLIAADDVGRAIPVLADDILVNFDGTRRRGAALALAELAAHRQVIVLTCHEATAVALREASPQAVRINL